jgi:hypothetical protein
MNLAVVVVVLALAAATFVLSYSGVHEIALQSGVSPRLARVYPATFDALLVIACAAAVMLREGRWWARGYAWLTIVIVIGVVGAADAVHAMKIALPHQKMEGVVAAAPWVLVLLGFSLMLTMLRHSRAQHGAAAGTPQPGPTARDAAEREGGQPALPPPAAIGPAPELTRNLVPAPVLPAAALPAADSDDHPPTLPSPALAEPEAAAGYGSDEHPADEAPSYDPDQELAAPTAADPIQPQDAGPDAAAETAQFEFSAPAYESGAAESVPFEFSAVAIKAAWPIEHVADGDDHDTGPGTEANTPEPAIPVWLQRVADSGDPLRQDYWDAVDESGTGGAHGPDAAGSPDSQDTPPYGTAPFTTAPRLNRVRATPIPPEEDEE